MTALCLIHDGQIVYCSTVNVAGLAVLCACVVLGIIAGNLIAERIRGKK